MKKLPSKLFLNCDIPESGDVGFFDIIPEGFCHEVDLYLSEETVAEGNSIEKAAQFFDKAANWDAFCRKLFLSFEEDSEEHGTVMEYFEFYQEEVPEVFGVEDVSALSFAEMVNHLAFKSMASHGRGDAQQFDGESNYLDIAWES